jgi:hypothetical protein
MVVSVPETPRRRGSERYRVALNSMLGRPRSPSEDAAYAPAGFDARFSASARVYRYRIDEGAVADPFRSRFVWHRPGGWPSAPLRAAARQLVGEHDYRVVLPAAGRGTLDGPAPPAADRRPRRPTASSSGSGRTPSATRWSGHWSGPSWRWGTADRPRRGLGHPAQPASARRRASSRLPMGSPSSGSSSVAGFDALAFPQVAWVIGRFLPGRSSTYEDLLAEAAAHRASLVYVVDAQGQTLGRMASEWWRRCCAASTSRSSRPIWIRVTT